MWNGYNKLMELFTEVAEDYLMGETTLQEAMGRFERDRAALFGEG